ncbi:MAG: hypothetical protein JW881_04815 [Spirochaetales bacterium]|nr:hypothetical protein [Spirochaetales bacterium]
MMKRILVCIVITGVFSCVFLHASEEEAIENLLTYAEAAIVYLQNEGYAVTVPDDAGQIFYMQEGQYIQIDGTFYYGTNYVFIASASSEATDVDIEVYDNNWNLIFNGNTDGIDSDVILTPSVTMEMHVMVKLTGVKTANRAAHVGFLMFYVQ